MNVIVLDINQGAWKLETERGVIMDGIQKIATAYEDFVSKKYGEFLDIHSKKKKKNKQADNDSHD